MGPTGALGRTSVGHVDIGAPPCVFCDIAARRTVPGGASKAIHALGSCVAFEPLNPVTPGHMLVVPVIHVRDASSSPLVTGWVFDIAADFAGNEFGLESFNLITSQGRAASQTIDHLHVHIVPRRPSDGLLLPWSDPWPYSV